MRWVPPPARIALATEDVHVWMVALAGVSGATAGTPAEALLAVLSADELERAQRFHFASDRSRFVTVRSALRSLIGSYLDIPAASVDFSYGDRGKPMLAPVEGGAGGLRFNVTHSGDVALLAFARGREVGIDIEQERPLPDLTEIAARYFSTGENATLQRLAPEERLSAFFRCWVRKEAFVKATGDGLALPLDAFEVTVDPGEPARLLRVEGDSEGPRRWLLVDLDPAPGFASALVVAGQRSSVACWAYDPLG